MTNGGYSKISGRKTQILVIVLIATILVLTIYAVYIAVRNQDIKTGSFYYEAPSPTPTEIPEPTPTIFIKPVLGD
jgi:hypothetical protein